MNEIETEIFHYRILLQYLQLDVYSSDAGNISEIRQSFRDLHNQFEKIVKLING